MEKPAGRWGLSVLIGLVSHEGRWRPREGYQRACGRFSRG